MIAAVGAIDCVDMGYAFCTMLSLFKAVVVARGLVDDSDARAISSPGCSGRLFRVKQSRLCLFQRRNSKKEFEGLWCVAIGKGLRRKGQSKIREVMRERWETDFFRGKSVVGFKRNWNRRN